MEMDANYGYFLSSQGGKVLGEGWKKGRRPDKKAFVNGILVGADCSNSFFWRCPSECILFLNAINNTRESHSIDNKLQLMTDVHVKWHTHNQGWRSIRPALCGGHYYKVTAPHLTFDQTSTHKCQAPALLSVWFDWFQIGGSLYHYFLIQNVES